MAATKPFIVNRMPGFGSTAIAVFLMLYLPIALLIIFSFNERESLAVWGGFSWRWYEAAWDNRDIKDAAFRSLWLAGVAASIATAAATLAAIATTRGKPFLGMTTVYAIINMPLMVPEIVTAVALLIFFAWIKVATDYTGAAYLVAAHVPRTAARGSLIGHAAHPVDHIVLEEPRQSHQHAADRAIAANVVAHAPTHRLINHRTVYGVENNNGIILHTQGAGRIDP